MSYLRVSLYKEVVKVKKKAFCEQMTCKYFATDVLI